MEPFTQQVLSACPLCGSGSLLPFLRVKDETVSKEFFQLVSCAACGFCFTNPRPDGKSIGGFYESEEYISHTNTRKNLQDWIYQLVRKHAIRGKYVLLQKFQAHGKVLDVGCGTGEFLAYLNSRGYTVHGVEPSPKARERASANHGIEPVSDLDRIPAQEQFQVITLWHVLEHVHDIRDTLRKLHARSSKGGLLIIAVPDRESWDAAHYGSNWAAYDVPRHLSHFRRRDLTRFLREQGYELMCIRSMWFDAAYVSMLSERYRGSGKAGSFLRGVWNGLISNLSALTSRRPTSSSLYVARKA